MLYLISVDVTITEEALIAKIKHLTTQFGSIVHVRASDVAFGYDAEHTNMSLSDYNELVREADRLLHPMRVAYFAKAYGL